MTEKSICFFNGTVVLPARTIENGVIVCRSGRIIDIGSTTEVLVPADAERIDAKGGILSPGYIDIHVHGGDNADFMDGTVAAARAACRAHARHGTTTIFPTTSNACAVDGARIAGVHFYGPYFAENKVGCHDKGGRRDPDSDEYLKDFDIGIIKIATCAAELPGAEAFYKEATRRGYLATCGHSNSSWGEMERAFRSGMRHVDHFWCAMSSVPSIRERLGNPMQGSMEQFVLMHKEMSTEVIADDCHLAPELLEFAYRMKGAERLCLCTDANRALGMPPGDYRFGPSDTGALITSDGKVGRQPGGGLASSIMGMDTMVRNMKAQTSASLVDAVRMGSLTPAERANIARDVGSLEVGKRADVLVLNSELQIKRVFIGGDEFK
jgi:N-acetylglucosamine-6-phosphate deacetylase